MPEVKIRTKKDSFIFFEVEIHNLTWLFSANQVDHIHVRNKSIGRIQAISLLNPDGKIFKSTMFDMIQVLYDDIESNTMNIKDTFSILRSSETPNNVNFLRGVKYRLTTQTEAKWFR